MGPNRAEEYPVETDLIYEPEEGDEVEVRENETETTCDGCGELLCLNEDIAIVQLVKPGLNEDTEVVFSPIMGEDGEPFLRTLYFHFPCYEMVGESIAEAVADAPPLTEPNAILDCDYCCSTIRLGETAGTVTLGELAISPRLKTTTTFVPVQDRDGSNLPPYVLCLSCVDQLAQESAIDEWAGVSQKGECSGCMKSKCWRAGRCICPCHNSEHGTK